MFEKLGHDDGLKDGHYDAASGRAEKAKPNLTMAIMSTGYLDAYMAAYHSGYRIQQAQQNREAVKSLNRKDPRGKQLLRQRRLHQQRTRSQGNRGR